jgi:hypothetical protein
MKTSPPTTQDIERLLACLPRLSVKGSRNL